MKRDSGKGGGRQGPRKVEGSRGPEQSGAEESARPSGTVPALLQSGLAKDAELLRLLKLICYMIIIAGGAVAISLGMPVIKAVVSTASPFVVGLIFAYIFDPIVTFVQLRLRLSRIGGVAILYLIFLLLIAGFFAIVLPILVVQIRSAWEGISGFLEKYVLSNELLREMLDLEWWKALWAEADTWLKARNVNLREMVDVGTVVRGAGDEVKSVASTGLRAFTGTVSGVFEVLYRWATGLVGAGVFWTFVVLVNIYLLLDFSKLRNVMEVMIPTARRDRVLDVLGKCDVAVGGFLRGMIIVAVLVGTLTFLGLFALGMKQYALLIGIMAGIGNLVPYMGSVSGGLPALLFVIFSDQYETTQERFLMGVGVLVLVGVIQALEGLVFQPRIVGQSAQLHPIAVLFALAVGANFGLLGMIIAVPGACIARVLLKEFYWDCRELDWRAATGKKGLGDRRDLLTQRQREKLRIREQRSKRSKGPRTPSEGEEGAP